MRGKSEKDEHQSGSEEKNPKNDHKRYILSISHIS